MRESANEEFVSMARPPFFLIVVAIIAVFFAKFVVSIDDSEAAKPLAKSTVSHRDGIFEELNTVKSKTAKSKKSGKVKQKKSKKLSSTPSPTLAPSAAPSDSKG